jgi:hypothetical protein
MLAVMVRNRELRQRYEEHKANAEIRGILFLFTFEMWVTWWGEQLGPNWFELRGQGKFCMARINDVGAYIPGNVKCITVGEDAAEWCPNRRKNVATPADLRISEDAAKALVKLHTLSLPPSLSLSPDEQRALKKRQRLKEAAQKRRRSSA